MLLVPGVGGMQPCSWTPSCCGSRNRDVLTAPWTRGAAKEHQNLNLAVATLEALDKIMLRSLQSNDHVANAELL